MTAHFATVLRTAVTAGAVAAVAVAVACSAAPAESPGPVPPLGSSAPTGAGTVTASPASLVSGLDQAPAGLRALATSLYAGGAVAANPVSATALTGRKPAGLPVAASASLGTWRGSHVAVVTAGADVTLAVADPQWRVVGGWWPSLGVATPALASTPRLVLVAGSDARPGEKVETARADSLHILGTDGHGGGGALGIPRDMWVPLASGRSGKINSSLTFGGPSGMLATVRAVSGLPLEGYVLTGFDGFVRSVDQLGGLPITILTAIKGQFSGVDLPAGRQTLGGGQALAFSRERKTLPTGDFARSAHQNDVLLAAVAQARTLGAAGVPPALTVLSGTTTSDLSAEQMLTFVVTLIRSDPARIGSGVASGPFGMRSGQSIVELGDHARALFAALRDGNLP